MGESFILCVSMEKFVDIEGYEGLYLVSNYGRIFSVRNQKYLKIQSCKGYAKVSLWNNYVRKHFLVHRLVAAAFIPNKDNLDQVNHKDLNKSNNRLSNLEWCTRQFNVDHAVANGRHPGKLTQTQVIEIRSRYGKETAEKLSLEYGICSDHVTRLVKGTRWRHVEM